MHASVTPDGMTETFVLDTQLFDNDRCYRDAAYPTNEARNAEILCASTKDMTESIN